MLERHTPLWHHLVSGMRIGARSGRDTTTLVRSANSVNLRTMTSTSTQQCRLVAMFVVGLLGSSVGCGQSDSTHSAPVSAEPDASVGTTSVSELDDSPPIVVDLTVQLDGGSQEDVYRPDVPIQQPPDGSEPPAPTISLSSIAPAQGPTTGGTNLVLLGRNLTATTEIYIGSERCGDIDFVDSTKMLCVSPENAAGRVHVKVIDGDDEFFLPGVFLYVSPILVDRIAPDSGPVSGGMPFEITGAGFTSSTSVSIGGRVSAATEVISSGLIRAITPPGIAGPQAVRVSNEYGLFIAEDGFTYYTPMQLQAVVPGVGRASGGDHVALRGSTALDSPDLWVLFGLLEATITDWPDGEDDAVGVLTPPGPANQRVEVVVSSDANGEFALADGFLFLPDDHPDGLEHIAPNVGAASGGYEVILSGFGVGLHEPSEVLFDGVSSEIVSQGDDYLVVLAPSHAPATIDVSVRMDGGLDTLRNGFTYIPGIELRGVSPSSGDVAGGTPFRLTGGGFVDGTRIYFGGLSAIDVEVTSSTVMTGVTPQGVLGFTDVEVAIPSGISETLIDGYEYVSEIEVFGLSPSTGSVAGGSVVLIRGRGFVEPMEVRFADLDVLSASILDSATIRVVTPPHDPGYVDVTVSRFDDVVVSPERFLYYDPSSVEWGGWGGEVVGSVNVTVLSNTGIPLPEAYVQLNVRGESLYSGETDPNGQITFSGDDLSGEQTINATRLGFSSATVQSIGATNVTVVLSCVPDGPCFTADGCRDEFVCTCGPPFQAPGVCLIDRFCGVEATTQEQFDAMCVPEYDTPTYGIITGRLSGLHKIVDPGPNERIMGSVVTTQPHPFIGSSVSPGLGNVMEDDGEFTLNSRLGEVAIIAMCGVRNDADNTFQPLLLGVERRLFVVAGEVLEVDIECNIELTEDLTIKAVNPPLDLENGPDNLRHRPWLHFGSEGYYGLPEIIAGTDDIFTDCCYPPLEDDLAGTEYFVVGGAYTGGGSPRSIVFLDGVSNPDDVMILPEFTPVVRLTTPGSADPLIGRFLEWELTNDNWPDFYDISISDPRDSRIVYWDVLVPGREQRVNLPFWPEDASTGIFPSGYLVLRITAVNAISFDYDNFDSSDFSFSNRLSYSYQAFILNNSVEGEE